MQSSYSTPSLDIAKSDNVERSLFRDGKGNFEFTIIMIRITRIMAYELKHFLSYFTYRMTLLSS